MAVRCSYGVPETCPLRWYPLWLVQTRMWDWRSPPGTTLMECCWRWMFHHSWKKKTEHIIMQMNWLVNEFCQVPFTRTNIKTCCAFNLKNYHHVSHTSSETQYPGYCLYQRIHLILTILITLIVRLQRFFFFFCIFIHHAIYLGIQHDSVNDWEDDDENHQVKFIELMEIPQEHHTQVRNADCSTAYR